MWLRHVVDIKSRACHQAFLDSIPIPAMQHFCFIDARWLYMACGFFTALRWGQCWVLLLRRMQCLHNTNGRKVGFTSVQECPSFFTTRARLLWWGRGGGEFEQCQSGRNSLTYERCPKEACAMGKVSWSGMLLALQIQKQKSAILANSSTDE